MRLYKVEIKRVGKDFDWIGALTKEQLDELCNYARQLGDTKETPPYPNQYTPELNPEFEETTWRH